MIRTAIYFGLWAALCMVAAILGFFLLIDLMNSEAWKLGRLTRDTLQPAAFLSLFALPAGVIAALGWWLLHRKDRRPRWWAYGLLAVAVVIVSHYLIFGALALSSWSGDLLTELEALTMMLMFHVWLSLPVALIGTALFVRWNRRRAGNAQA